MTLPTEFTKQMTGLLGSEYSDFEYAMQQKPAVSIRINPAKPENELKLSDQVAWCTEGFYIEDRPIFTLDPFFHAGHYYVQEASSMFLDYILKKLNLSPKPRILDLCSAPGGKSSLLLSHLQSRGILHCHEFDVHRHSILKQNIIRWGYPNAIVTYGSLLQLQKLNIKYDVILIDAPCSGEGMFRKEEDALKQWNNKKIGHCQNIQRHILSIADTLCAQQGYIIYSSCTWNTRENEEVLEDYIISNRYEAVEIKHDFPIPQSNKFSFTYRMYPHKIKGEGFTISVIKKQSDTLEKHRKTKSGILLQSNVNTPLWLNNSDDMVTIFFKDHYFAIPKDLEEDTIEIFEKVNTSSFGIPLGSFKGDDFYPAHGLSQSILLRNDLESIDLNKQQALNYLRALTPDIVYNSGSKWLTGKYKSASLGWIKSLSTGLKNYFPKNQRIISF